MHDQELPKARQAHRMCLRTELLHKQCQEQCEITQLETKFDAHMVLLNEHTKVLNEHTRVLSEHTARFDHLEALLTQILERLPKTS